MECVDVVCSIRMSDFWVDEKRDPVVTLACLDSIHAETTRQTRYTTKHGLKCFSKEMGNIVFKDWKTNVCK